MRVWRGAWPGGVVRTRWYVSLSREESVIPLSQISVSCDVLQCGVFQFFSFFSGFALFHVSSYIEFLLCYMYMHVCY